MIKKLSKSIREYKTTALLTPLYMIGEVAMEVLIPTLMALIIDNGVYNSDISYIVKLSILIVVAAILSMAFGIMGAKSGSKASCGFAKNLRHDLFHHIQDFSFKNIDSFSTSSLITRLTTDVQNVQQAFQMIIRICFRAPIMFIFAIIMVVHNGGALVAVFAVAIPVLIIFCALFIKKVFPIFNRIFKHYDKLNRVVEENLTCIRTVKAYVREELEKEKFDSSSSAIHDDFVKAQKMLVLINPVVQSVSYACILAICYLGARLISVGDMRTGELMSVFTYTMQILSSLIMIAMILVQLSMSKASAERIIEVLEAKPEMDLNENGLKSVEDGSVVFEHTNFSYSGKDTPLVLHDINLEIKSGEMVGILGPTGSGKSSLISLIARLYDVTSGSVKVGGHDVRDYDIKALRDGVSVVLQKNTLFSGTVRSNLLWGNENASDEELTWALKSANADFVFTSKDGLDTVVEQGGNNFSGGQKQRLCIARALVKKPKVLIFDDSTSAVDTATDFAIRSALRRDVKNCTKIIIAQRVNSVMDADKIVILENGYIDDVGTHDELLSRNKTYQDLVKVQLGGKDNG
ncbi:ABC transporter ATP-binding protein [Bullifex porci]|uniref:ABC transporter ATP-binding protein n=1 Tax=Bullifex porci TaxID=2606638 RepID=UPI0023F11385|nr:ABC transporter ATP-binding protein [Bullifex porci]MDD7254847.1 ABC transporter ATP-binding protein [Bullifex porci]MDY2741122.1 ABC transporter ATP-binding protein [Bullifex porci]